MTEDTLAKQVDRLLEGLRACGEDQYRADPDDLHRWMCYCPCCASELIDARSLVVRELPGGRALLSCWRGCSAEHVLAAIRMAEQRWELPAGIQIAQEELQRLAEAKRLDSELLYQLAA